MILIQNLTKKISKPYVVLTMGTFDGLHLGHQTLIQKVLTTAKKNHGTSIVLTFWPHPRKILFPDVPLKLLFKTKKEKIDAFKKLSLDVLVLLRFTKKVSAIPARDFIQQVLVQKLGVREVFIGYDHRFGYKGEGDSTLLKKLGKEYGFVVHVVKPVLEHGKIISSTNIRKTLKK